MFKNRQKTRKDISPKKILKGTNVLPPQNVSFGILISSWLLRSKRLRKNFWTFRFPACRSSDRKTCFQKGILALKPKPIWIVWQTGRFQTKISLLYPLCVPLFLVCPARTCLPHVFLWITRFPFEIPGPYLPSSTSKVEYKSQLPNASSGTISYGTPKCTSVINLGHFLLVICLC